MASDSEQDPKLAALEGAFRSFQETSERLQGKYELLLEETQSLRDELRRKDEEIKKKERLSMLGETAAAIAHEVRNPLGAMKLFLSMLKEDLAANDAALKLVSEINKSLSTLDGVIANILQFARMKALTFVPMQINPIIQEQVEIFEETYPDVSISLSLAANPFISGNEHALRQVLSNLLSNSIQAMKGNGEIRIISSDTADKEFQLIVWDRGPGIPAALMTKLFEPFISSKCEGTGLGLAIVKQIVESHRGLISVSNDGGAKFVITLPRKGTEKGE